MKRYLLYIKFNGSSYCGWQVQKNGISIQSVIQDALQGVFGVRLNISGCSRTDSGVHAYMYCCHFDTESQILPYKIIKALNHYLPKDITVFDCRDVPLDFHSRYSCLHKNYIYKIWNSSIRNPFLEGMVLHYIPDIDVDYLQQEVKCLCGTHEFTSFSNGKEKINENIRTVHELSVKRENELIEISISADGFLYNMIRIIVGTLLEINKDRNLNLKEILSAKDRKASGRAVVAHGLYLNKIYYNKSLNLPN